ncbi:carbohydrate-binding protein [Formosa algae]|uniref:CBM6 domain-containing protein n=1 Tax=Formosa algae TaxID=225843 RepID=A0A9X0YQR5_9FLAO|nr:carbohydrate-binding protein [Formosa algae]MBP1841268.1 hypothetical protein [Formosa algae]MDQ0336809.1 hypothetical protein [Formosa algae]OEI80357.1 hypothetical protein AST99_09685 [Formosa algae]
MKKITFLFTIGCLLTTAFFTNYYAQTVVTSLFDLRNAVVQSNQNIVLQAGDYNFEDLPSKYRNISISGSNNVIDLTDVYINFPISTSNTAHITVTGDNNTIRGGVFEDTYSSGITEITDFVAYNEDRTELAVGADPHIIITGDAEGTRIVKTKMTVRGSFPYGYGSLFGIGAGNTYGLDKRAGIQINGPNTEIDSCEVQMRAFGHGIFIGEPAANTLVKNTLVEGVVRKGSELYADGENSLLAQNDYKDNDGNVVDPDDVISLCEDGIRMYNGGGRATVENCVVKKMRGGIKLYLSSEATVSNSTSIDCGDVNFNMPTGGTITNSIGNFAYEELSDFAGNKNGYNAEWTILPSPHATGSHNIADVSGNNHYLVFHRADGPLDTDEERAIVVTGNNSTIINETEYAIILEASASGNIIYSCGGGAVTDNGTDNTVTQLEDCADIEMPTCGDFDPFSRIEAEDYCDQSGVELEGSSQGTDNLSYIHNGDWVMYSDVDFGDQALSVSASMASPNDGGNIEFRLGSTTGTLIGTATVGNTGGWQTYETVTANLTAVSGVQDLYLVFTGEGSSLFNLDYFQFFTTLGVNDIIESTIKMYPNPIKNELHINKAMGAKVDVFDSLGKLILSSKLSTNDSSIDTSSLTPGLYFVRLEKNNAIDFKKIIKE